MSGELPALTADELERLRRENQELREGRLELVREMNRVIALGDYGMRCATAEGPHEVLDRALDLLGAILDVELRVAFGLGKVGPSGGTIDAGAFAPPPASADSPPGHSPTAPGPFSISPEIDAYLRGVPVATIQRVGDTDSAPALDPLLDALFPDQGSWENAIALIIPLRPKRGETLGAIIACKRRDGSADQSGPQDRDATFLILLSNHVDRALQSALLVSDLRGRGEELAESTRRFRENLENLERTQKQLREARKLEAIGRLAGGVAHDFNNLLTVITNHVEFLRESFQEGSTELEDVLAIREATERATRITRQLLAFGRRNDGRLEVLDVNRVANELTRGLGRLVGERVRIDLKLEATIGPVRADRAQLEQILLNLLFNARDAMPEGGVITLRTRHVEMSDLADTKLAQEPTQFVALVVSDTGCGMDEATRARLFEPFFTTKGPGQGTGLGLATVYGIVEKHGGHIAVLSQPGKGSSFTILLRGARRSATMEAVRPRGPGESEADRQRSERSLMSDEETATILLVEDDSALRRAALRTLRAKGFNVLEARDGEEGVALANAYAGEIDLIVTDVVMPRMSGPKLVAAVRARRPEIKVIYISGYTFDMLDPRSLEDGSFLTKPFSPDDLISVVRSALSAR